MQQLSAAQASPEVVVNENFETLEHQAVYGKDPTTTTGLTWGYVGGRWGGFSVADGTVSLNASSTVYMVAAVASGAVSISTSSTNWGDSATYRRIYKFTTSGSAVTAVEDHRAGPGGVHGTVSASGLTIDSDDVSYAATTVADWDGAADPGDVEQALDQLAERVTDVEAAATVTVVTSSAGVVTLNCALGDYYTLALSENVSSITFSNLPGSGKGASKFVRITQDSTPRTVAWPAAFKWAGGSAGAVSTGSGDVDFLAITTPDNGSTWLATLAKDFA